MEETEKMLALKKAYAEIILNTAKEAAARIMVSERKVQECNYNLKTTKDEALRLLLRLKQSMDDKINGAEMKSLDQQRNIEVLEAQLQEAEDIVSNLRAELDEAHTKLDKLEKNQMCSVSKSTYTADNEIGSSQPEIPSIIRRKEPELYLKGCTQRLRTCNGNLLKGHLNNMKGLREDKEGEIICVEPPVVADITCVEEEESADIKEVEDEEPVNIMQIFKSLRKRRKSGSKVKRNNASSPKRVSLMSKEVCSDLSTSHAHPPGFHDIHESDDEDNSTQSFDVSEMGTLPEHVLRFQSDDKLTKVVNDDREVAKSLALTKKQSAFEGSLDVLGLNTEAEVKKSLSVDLDVKLLETCDELSSPLSKDKVLKYTFQRKRKRESVNEDNSILDEENPSREKMTKKHNGNLKHVKSSEVNGSLRDGRRMAEVARQLVSMSEKKWIK